MEIAIYIVKAAQDVLAQGASGLPRQLADTAFYVAMKDDSTVVAYGVVRDREGTEYKIGPKKER